MSGLWQRLTDSYSPGQKFILKVCTVIIVIGLIILGVDRYIVQPRSESAAIDRSSIRIKRELPALDLGLDAQVERTHEKLDRLREARERERRERQASPDPTGNSERDGSDRP